MSRSAKGPTPLGEVLRAVLERIGVVDLDVWDRVEEQWAALAGPPWDQQSVPRSLRSGVLVVEANDAGSVSLLRYGVDGLTRRLQEELGPEVVTEVRVRPPLRRRR